MKRTINAIAVFTALCVVLTTSCFAADSSTLHNSDSSQYIVTNFCIDGAERECIAEITSTPSTEPGVIAHRVSYYIPTTDDQQIETDRIISQIESGITPFAHSSQNDIFYECQFVLEILEKRDPQIIKIDGKYVDFNYIQIEEVNYGNFPHPAGEGRVNVSDEEIIIRQIGYNKYPGTPSSKEVSFEHIISAEPGSGFHVRNEDSLLQWTPPSTWEPVAHVEGYGVLCVAGHYGATVRNSMGETCEIDLVCNVASTSIWG